MYFRLINILLIIFIFVACSENVPKPKIVNKKQFIKKTLTSNHFKVIDFKNMIDNDDSIAPIYIYIKDSLKSETSSVSLPNIKKLTYSVLSDFGSKVIVVSSPSKYEIFLKDKYISKRLFVLDGALTSFDENIESESSSTSLSLSFGSGDKKVKNKDRFKDKKKISQLISDFYLKQNGIVNQKTTSSIFIRETNKGYSFGLNLYGLSLGVSSFKNIKDGVGLSVRKIVEASMIDLIAKAIGIKTFQVIPEIQARKIAKKVSHLSNFDFCSDMNKIVFYINALTDDKFNSYGITKESELNKLNCVLDLYKKEKNKIYIKLISMKNKDVNLSQAQRNAQFLRRKLTKIGIPRNILIMNNKSNHIICKEELEYCKFIGNRVELEKVVRQ